MLGRTSRVTTAPAPIMAPAVPPMAVGLYGYLGYDMVRLVEKKLGPAPPDSLDLPDAVLLRPN